MSSYVFIDARVPEYELLLTALPPDAQVVILDPARDGVVQLAQALAGVRDLDAIHIVSHGAEGTLHGGATVLTCDTLARYANELATVGAALTGTGDVLLYGCDVANGTTGQTFIEQLAQYTGADIAASTNTTGSSAINGDWVLEAATGEVAADVFLSSVYQKAYPYALSDSISADTNTTGIVLVGQAVTGELEFPGDHDWYQVSLIAGHNYQFDLQGTATGLGTLGDPLLVLLTDSGALISLDDDSGVGTDSSINFVASRSGSYFLSAQGFNESHAGTFSLRAIDASAIANTFLGDGDDNNIVGTAFNDGIYGLSGNDILYGLNGNDVLVGGEGIDALVGGEGSDIIDGGPDADILYGDNAADSLYGGTGFSTDILLGGAGNDTLDGSASVESGEPRSAGDFDYLYGEGGNDTYFVDTPADLTFEFEGFLGGTDTVIADIGGGGYYLYQSTENLTLTGSTYFGVGNDQDNVLIGNAMANLLIGLDGNDQLYGGTGFATDLLYGGPGNDTLDGSAASGSGVARNQGDFDYLHGEGGDDTYFVDTAADLTFESNGTAGGIDTVVADIADGGCYLYDSVENLTLRGSTRFGVGNGQNNVIIGNDEANLLLGEGGNDLLYGGPGFATDILFGGPGDDTLDGSVPRGSGPRNLGEQDFLHGEDGNDIYFVDNLFDYTFESDGLAGGSDTVIADMRFGNSGYYLYDGVENLVLAGFTFFGVGNAQNNLLSGNFLSNLLLGGAGDDRLFGGQGNDVLAGEAGADTFIFDRESNSDVIADFQTGIDKIFLVGSIYNTFSQVRMAMFEHDGNTAIDLGLGDQVVLNGVAMASLTAADFVFA